MECEYCGELEDLCGRSLSICDDCGRCLDCCECGEEDEEDEEDEYE